MQYAWLDLELEEVFMHDCLVTSIETLYQIQYIYQSMVFKPLSSFQWIFFLNSLIHSLILETYIAPIQETTT